MKLNYPELNGIKDPIKNALNFFTIHGLEVVQIRDPEGQSKDYLADDGILVELGPKSTNFIGVHLKTKNARILAKHFLAPAGWILSERRKGMSRCDYLYRSKSPGSSESFYIDGQLFAEYRSEGACTLFPPAIGKGRVRFDKRAHITAASRGGLIKRLSLMTICGIVYPFYLEKEPQRNELTYGLSSLLFSHNVDKKDVQKLIRVLCRITKDAERLKRIRTVHDAFANYLHFEPERHLSDLIGSETVTEVCASIRLEMTRSLLPI